MPTTGPVYSTARVVLRPLLRAVSGREWRGSEHLPATGGFVVVANHLSHVDPLPVADFLDAAGRIPRFLGKSELFDVPVLGPLLRSAGQIPVARETQHAGIALSAAVDAVRRGECVVVYPDRSVLNSLMANASFKTVSLDQLGNTASARQARQAFPRQWTVQIARSQGA